MKKRTGAVIGIILLIFCGTALCGGIEFSINPAGFPVFNGNVRATIVYNPADSGYTVTAYQELQKFLTKTTGQSFALMTESAFNSSNGKLPIYVGNCTATTQALGTQLATVDRDGFMIVVEPRRIFIVGPRDYSTYWGVLAFLEDYAGVRWLMPGPLGEDILPKSKIIISPMKRIEIPVILSRQWSGHTLSPYGPEWTMRMRVQHRYEFHHNMQNVVPYDASHAEYFAYINGARTGPDQYQGVNICYTNPDVPHVAANNARAAFTANPDQESFSLAPNDSATYCQCKPGVPPAHAEPYCDQLYAHNPPTTGYWHTYVTSCEASDLVFYWTKKVEDDLKTTHPDKILGCESYSWYTAWPLNVTLTNSNIMPYICQTTSDWYVPVYRSAIGDLITEWGNRCKNIGIYDYAYGETLVHPHIYNSLIQDQLQFGVLHNLKGVYAEEYPNWGWDAPRVYMTAKLWWNPFIDREAMENDWCDRMFKEAAAPMKRHFERCESAWINYDGYIREPTVKRLSGGVYEPWVFTQSGRTSQFEVFTPEVVAASTADFDEAASLAQSQIIKDRLQFFRKTWDLCLAFNNAYWAGEGLNSYIARGCTLQQAADVLKKMPNSYERSYFLGEISSRVGGDFTAFYAINPGDTENWWAGGTIPKEASIRDYQWVANQLAAEVMTHPQAERQAFIDQRINELFGTGGTAKFQRAAALIRHMVMDQTGVLPVIPQGSLMAYYKFDETSGNTANDLTPNHIPATLVGDIIWVNDTTRGRCINFDGDKDYIYFGTLGKNLNKDISISCWTKVDDVTRSTGFTDGLTSTSSKLGSYLPVNNVEIRVYWENVNVLTSMIGYTSNNAWYHWVFTKSYLTGESKLYLNGVKKATMPGSTGTLTDIVSLTIGSMNNTYYKGLLDDVSIWSKILSDTEVLNICTYGIDLDYQQPILKYKLNDRARNSATDSSGNGYHGTFSSPGPLWTWGADQHGTNTWTLSFDGTTHYISVPSAVLSQINDKITVTFWQKGDTGAQCDLFNAKKADDSVFLSCKLPWVNGGNNYVTWDAGSPLDTISKAASASNYTGTWNHWALTKNATTGQQKIYLNGTLWHSGTSKTSLMSGGSSIQIGTGPDGYYSGLISDFRIYNIEVNSEGVGKIYSGQY